MRIGGPFLRRAPVLVAAAIAGSIFALAPVAAVATPVAPSATAFPATVPIDQITPGLVGTGLTVNRGGTPEPFTVTVLGVLPNAIGSGVDMIVFEGSSPALDAAGGIWAGMSGSPVFTSDGRLIGAVSYGFTAAPSKIGGMTPGVQMVQLFNNPAALLRSVPGKVRLPDSMRQNLVDTGRASLTQAAAGLAPLPIPLSVSGLNANRLARLNEDLQRSGSPLRAYAGGAASGTAAPAGSLFAGSNFAAAVSYGDITQAAIGTTTLVYNGKAIAFGHPMLFSGPASMSAHQATSIAVVRDDTMGSFKMAVVGGVAGTVDQDRMVGLRTILGAGPVPVPVTSTVRFGTTQRTATTWVTTDSFVSSTTMQHLVANIDRVFDRMGAGRTEVSWVIRGTRASGATWRLARSNMYASTYDASWDSVTEISQEIDAIVSNPFEAVKVTDISITATVRADYGMYTVSGVQARQGGTWVDLSDTVVVTPGQPLDLRVQLQAYRGTTQVVQTQLDVPADATSGGSLGIAGMYVEYPDFPTATSFPGLLAAMRNAPHNNQLMLRLQVAGDGVDRTVERTVSLGECVSGSLDYVVEIG